MTVYRREFLQYSGGAVGLSLLGSACGSSSPRAAQSRGALTNAPLPPGTPIVVMIELGGGNDILNTHVPHNVPNVTSYYLADRPSLAIRTVTSTRPYVAPAAGGSYLPPGLDLDGKYAFHGSLPWLANRWHDKADVAIVQGVGEDVAKEMSHFAAMAYRWAAAFTGPNLGSGWLGRYNDVRHAGQAVPSVSVSGYNASLVGNATSPVVVSGVPSFNWMVASNAPSRPRLLTDMQAFGAAPLPAAMNKAALAAAAIGQTNAAISAVGATSQPAMNTGVAQGTLSYQLSQVAMMILGGLPSQTYYASLGGFDTHGAQAYNHYVALFEVDKALQRFFGYIDASPRANDVFVLITSEFGRQVKQNAGGGTDHGRASSAILVGGGVRGGLYGQMPRFDVRYFDALIPTVDFRALFATILNRLGGAPLSAAALGKDENGADFPDLGIFGAPVAAADMATGVPADLRGPPPPADLRTPEPPPADLRAPVPPDLRMPPPPADLRQPPPTDMNGAFRDDMGRMCICY